MSATMTILDPSTVEREARELAAVFLDDSNPYAHGLEGDLYAAGWTYLGCGDHRAAWLSPAGVVYKVGDADRNEAEHATLTRIGQEITARGLDHLGVPTVHLLADTRIIAAEYVPDDDPAAVEGTALLLVLAGDLNESNVHHHAGRAWLIDGAGA